MKIVRMVQGSPEWHEHRRTHRNASETPVVLGVSPWQTPYALWEIKLGLREQVITPAMRHGSELEPVARKVYEERTGVVMNPAVVVDGEYSASLDGITFAGDRLLEIKSVMKGRESALWQAVEGGGHLPAHIAWQVQHQLLVSKAEAADVFVFDGEDGIVLEVLPDPTAWPGIREAWQTFAQYVATKTPPPLCDRDKRTREDAEWLSAARHYLDIKLAAEQAQRALTEAKECLVTLSSHTCETGGGVSVTRYWKAGAIDYKKVPELHSLDLEQYRGAPREEVRITVV